MLTSFAPVLAPRTLDEALALRAAHPEALPLAGGTDVMVFVELGALDPPRFLNLWGLEELVGIVEGDGGLWVGALTTHIDLVRDARVPPILAEAARTVGALQIQNRGTLGGNIANASPAGDTLPVLLALDAEIEVASAARGRRRVAADRFFTGYRTLAMEPDELVTRVFLPAPAEGDHAHFRKVGTRLAQAISKVVFAGRVRLDAQGTVTAARLAFGSVAPTPVRAVEAEQALVGGRPRDRLADALAALDAAVRPIDDIRSTAAYRRTVARRVTRAWLESIA